VVEAILRGIGEFVAVALAVALAGLGAAAHEQLAA